MNAKHLIAHFDRISEAPGAVVRLRRFITDLAVAGCLSSRSPDDAPVDEKLLAERLKGEKQPKGRTGGSTGPVDPEEVGISIPASWRWARIHQLCEHDAPVVYGILQPGPDLRPDGVPYIRPSEIKNGEVQLSHIRHTSEEIAAKYTRSRVKTGDVVLTIVGTLGAMTIVPKELDGANITQSSCRLRADGHLISREFLLLGLKSTSFTRQVTRLKLGTAVPRLNIAHVRSLAVPVPPLAEQERIVAKVEELMKLCDELEEAQTSRERRRDRLATASQRRLVEATGDEEAFHASADFYLKRVPRLTTRPEHISELRRTILDLAVRGHVATPDPDDEPVEKLTERLKDDVRQRTASGDYSDPQRFVDIRREDLPFTIPERWAWARLVEVAHVSYGFAFASSRFNNDRRGRPLIRIRDISKVDTEAYFDGEYQDSYLVRADDHLVGMDGDFNVRQWHGPDALLNQRVMRIRDWRLSLVPEFFAIPLQMILNHLHSSTSLTTVKHLSAKQVNGIYLPLPPLGEQQRIVARVGELMTVCDDLEARIDEGRATQVRLLESVLHEALHSAS